MVLQSRGTKTFHCYRIRIIAPPVRAWGAILFCGAIGMSEQYYDKDGRPIIVGDGAIDYLSMTTFDPMQLEYIEDILNREWGITQTTEVVNQYMGAKWADYVFMGVKRRGTEIHTMVIATSYHSDKLLRHMMVDDRIKIDRWKCTRVDVQTTVKARKRDRRLGLIGVDLEKGKYGKISNRREIKVKNIMSSDGDTIYIGKPSSEKQRRIYDKFLTSEADNVEKFQRYEIQYRHNTAQGVLQKITSGGVLNVNVMIQRVIKGDLSILPSEFVSKLPIDKWQPKVIGVLTNRARRDTKNSNTTKWIRNIRYALLKACSQRGNDGLVCRETLFEAIIIAITESNIENWVNWRLISGEGEIVDVAGNWYNEV
jgi:hypothetical protein